MNTRSLRIFMEVASTGSFSAAARNLGLTQPAVSSQIRSLEKDFGSTLIDRSTAHCRLTEAGLSLLEHARRILDTEDELRREMEGRGSEISGPISIAASNIPGGYIMPYILSLFRERYPLADPRLDIADSGKVLERVRAGDVDIGCVGLREEDDRLRYGRLCEDRLVFIAPPSHPLSRGRTLRPEDLEGEHFIWREEGSGTRSHMSRVLADLGIEATAEGSMRLGSTMAVVQAVASGAGVSVVSLWAASVHLRQGEVALIHAKSPELIRDFYCVTLRRRPLTSAASALLKQINEVRPELEERLRSLRVT